MPQILACGHHVCRACCLTLQADPDAQACPTCGDLSVRSMTDTAWHLIGTDAGPPIERTAPVVVDIPVQWIDEFPLPAELAPDVGVKPVYFSEPDQASLLVLADGVIVLRQPLSERLAILRMLPGQPVTVLHVQDLPSHAVLSRIYSGNRVGLGIGWDTTVRLLRLSKDGCSVQLEQIELGLKSDDRHITALWAIPEHGQMHAALAAGQSRTSVVCIQLHRTELTIESRPERTLLEMDCVHIGGAVVQAVRCGSYVRLGVALAFCGPPSLTRLVNLERSLAEMYGMGAFELGRGSGQGEFQAFDECRVLIRMPHGFANREAPHLLARVYDTPAERPLSIASGADHLYYLLTADGRSVRTVRTVL